MDVDGGSISNIFSNYGNDSVVNTLVISAKFTTDLASNTVEVSLPYQIPHCYAVEVEHFSMVDDGTPLPINPNGDLLILRSSNLASGSGKNRYFMSQTDDSRAFSLDIYNNVLAWCVSGRKNTTVDFYPLGLPQQHRKIFLEAEQMLQRFQLNIDNINGTIHPHTTPYTLQVVMKVYSRC